jgi:uncharacterized SAM-binding protein YcdF (DUF218 family)
MAGEKRSRFGLLGTLAALAVVLAVAWFAGMSVQIARQSGLDEAQKADAIVVFGAAQYYGRPSPIYRARLDHAYTLFTRGYAPLIITSGGKAEDPRYSEGGVGRDYLVSRGIPDGHVIAETQANDTSQSAERVANIMRANGMHTCIAVSDGYHMFRVTRMLSRQGVVAYPSPRPDSHVPSRWTRIRANLREAISYTAWKLGI